MGQWLQRLFGSADSGAAEAATIQGYLRAASQIEEVWQQIDERVEALLRQGIPPWEAFVSMGYALAFVRAARLNVLFVQALLKASVVGDPAHSAPLAKITYAQALALCEHFEPYIEEALKAATNPRYTLTSYRLPLALGPRMGDAAHRLPPSHLQGIIGAGQEMRSWAAGLLAKYELALQAAQLPAPAHVTAHVEKMRGELELGDFHLRSGTDMVGQISLGQSTDELNARAEGLLWEAMAGFYTVSQLIALSSAPPRPAPSQRPAETQNNPAAPVNTNASTASHAQEELAREAARRNPPVQPEEDASQLFDQVITSSHAPHKAPARASEDVARLMDQVTAHAEHSPEAAHVEADGATLLDQVTAHPTSQATQQKPPVDNTLELLGGIVDAPETGPKKAPQGGPGQKLSPGRQGSTPERQTEDAARQLLSEICGEEPESHT